MVEVRKRDNESAGSLLRAVSQVETFRISKKERSLKADCLAKGDE